VCRLIAFHLAWVFAEEPQFELAFDVCQFNSASCNLDGGGGFSITHFDHYNDLGYNGGIEKICFNYLSSETRRRRQQHLTVGLDVVEGIIVGYAGSDVAEDAGSSDSSNQGCFPLRAGDLITGVKTACWNSGHVKSGIKLLVANYNGESRQSEWFGATPSDESVIQSHTAPDGKHLVALAGTLRKYSQGDGHDVSWVDKLKLGWGTSDNKAGRWETIHSCAGCGPTTFEKKVCSVVKSSQKEVDTTAWALSIKNELSSSFTFFGSHNTDTLTVEKDWAGSVVKSSSQAFETTDCETTTTTCEKTYFMNFVLSASMLPGDESKTYGPDYVCVDELPCCLPGTYTNDPSYCPDSPNLCGSDDGTIVYLGGDGDGSMCWDLANGDTTNGNAVQLWACDGLFNQRWVWEGDRIMFAGDRSKCVDVSGGPWTAGNQLQIWDCVGNDNQKFGYDAASSSIYLESSADGESTCVDLPNGQTSNGNQLWIWQCDKYDNQFWGFGTAAQHFKVM